jgi:hypothetical protein
MGMFPMRPDVSVYEPGQKAIIAWSDGKEIMILSTDANASQATRALRVLPLPSMPKIQTGSFDSFEAIQRLINMHMPRPSPGWPGKETLGVAPPPPAVEILFHERIGAHDITVAKANDYVGFVEWARNFVGEAGFSLPSRAEPIIEQYIKDDVRYFVFDIVEITEQESSIEPIVYEFETPVLYYPLVISTLIPGETKITLFLITEPQLAKWTWTESTVWPLSLAYYLSAEDIPISFELTPGELASIDTRIAELFEGSPAQLTVLKYEGPLQWLTRDLKLSLISQISRGLSATIWVDKGCGSTYAIGERITIYYKVNEDAAVTILDYATDGSTQVLLSQTVSAGIHSITGIVSGPPGEEELEVSAKADGEGVRASCAFRISSPEELCIALWTDKQEYRINEPSTFFYSVNKACTVRLTDFKPDGSIVVWGPHSCSPIATQSETGYAGYPTGLREVILEAWAGSEYKKVITYFNVVD